MRELTYAELQQRVEDLEQTVASAIGALASEQQRTNEMFTLLFARIGEPTHLSVEEVARLRGKSVKTIRRAIDRGELTLEHIPGTQLYGVPITQVHSRWLDVRTFRTARDRERQENTR